jgi:hypothetical protein
MRENELQTATDNRLLVFASIEYAERSPFMVITAHNGSEIIDELIYPDEFGAVYTMRKIAELVEIYGKYANMVELQTDNKELMRLGAETAGVHVRPKRKELVEIFTKRTFDTYAAGGFLYEIYDHIKEPKKLSRLRTWLINTLQKTLDKLEGER